MKNFHCFGHKLFSTDKWVAVIVVALLFGSVSLSSCSKDDPVNPVKNHRPSGNNPGDEGGSGSGDDGNGTGSEGTGSNSGSGSDENGTGSGDDRTESELRIVGVWVRNDGLEKLNLGLDGSYIAYSCAEKGSDWVKYADGHYVYHDLANALWIEVFGDDEDVAYVYRTVFEGREKLTLWSADNSKRTFTRI